VEGNRPTIPPSNNSEAKLDANVIASEIGAARSLNLLIHILRKQRSRDDAEPAPGNAPQQGTPDEWPACRDEGQCEN
jgi:hypothetical protein